MKSSNNPVGTGGITDFVPFFKAFCNPIRAQIIEFLLGGERCVCEMTGPLDQSQPLVSHHLALLREAGMVRMRSEGARTYYSIDYGRFDCDLDAFLAYIEKLREAPPAPVGAGVGPVRPASSPVALPDDPDEKETNMKLEILGSGCANCQKLMAVTREAVGDLGLSDTELVKVEDYPKIMAYGVMSTPALVIDGKVVLSGKVPSKADVISLVTTALADKG